MEASEQVTFLAHAGASCKPDRFQLTTGSMERSDCDVKSRKRGVGVSKPARVSFRWIADTLELPCCSIGLFVL